MGSFEYSRDVCCVIANEQRWQPNTAVCDCSRGKKSLKSSRTCDSRKTWQTVNELTSRKSGKNFSDVTLSEWIDGSQSRGDIKRV